MRNGQSDLTLGLKLALTISHRRLMPDGVSKFVAFSESRGEYYNFSASFQFTANWPIVLAPGHHPISLFFFDGDLAVSRRISIFCHTSVEVGNLSRALELTTL